MLGVQLNPICRMQVTFFFYRFGWGLLTCSGICKFKILNSCFNDWTQMCTTYFNRQLRLLRGSNRTGGQLVLYSWVIAYRIMAGKPASVVSFPSRSWSCGTLAEGVAACAEIAGVRLEPNQLEDAMQACQQTGIAYGQRVGKKHMFNLGCGTLHAINICS